jgi:dienelactone hydrolase
LVRNLTAGDYAAAAADFDAKMAAALPADKLKATWESVLAQIGPFQEMLPARVESQGSFLTVITPLRFEKMSLDASVTVDPATGKVGGLFFAPGKPAGPTPTPIVYAPPPYAFPDRFEEREVTVGGGEWAVSGTLTLPKGGGPFPAVVLVAGSGPNDRDETIGPNKPLRDLAWGLASNGVAVLRADKRTLIHGARMMALPGGFTVQEEAVDDAVAAAGVLRQTPGVDPARVFVLGHSLGGTLAPRIGAADSQVKGLVILAGATRPLLDLMAEQAAYLQGLQETVSDADRANLAALEEQIAKARALAPGAAVTDTQNILGAPPAYWQDLNGYQPAEAAGSLRLPMLILQGERDYQVTLADFKGWQDALDGRADATFKTYPDLNHLFMAGQGRSTPDEYGAPGHVAEQVVRDISDWIKQQ